MTKVLQTRPLTEFLFRVSESRYADCVVLRKVANEMKSPNPRAMVRRIWEMMAKKKDLHSGVATGDSEQADKFMSEQTTRSVPSVGLMRSRARPCEGLGVAITESSEPVDWIEALDWDYVCQEVYGKGTTVKQIQREVAPETVYLKFWRVFREKVGHQVLSR